MNLTRGSVPVVDPTLERPVDAADHNARPDDHQREIPLVLLQPRLGQRLRESVRVGPVPDEPRRKRVQQRFVQRLDQLHDLVGTDR